MPLPCTQVYSVPERSTPCSTTRSSAAFISSLSDTCNCGAIFGSWGDCPDGCDRPRDCLTEAVEVDVIILHVMPLRLKFSGLPPVPLVVKAPPTSTEPPLPRLPFCLALVTVRRVPLRLQLPPHP